MVELPPLEVFRRCEDVAFREWFTPGFSSEVNGWTCPYKMFPTLMILRFYDFAACE